MNWRDRATPVPQESDWRSRADKVDETPEPVGLLEAYGYGATNAIPVVGEYRDELYGGWKSPRGGMEALKRLVGVDFDQAKLEEYLRQKEAYKARDEQAWAEQPGMYSLGGATTGLATLGTGLLSKAPSATRALQGAMAVGGAEELGRSEGGEIAAPLAQGMTTGGMFSLPFLKAGQVAKSVPFERYANERAYNVTGGLKSDINQMYHNTPEQVGEQLRREGMIGWLTPRGDPRMLQRINQEARVFKDYERDMARGIKEAVDPGAVFDRMGEKVAQQSMLHGGGEAESAFRKVQKRLFNIAGRLETPEGQIISRGEPVISITDELLDKVNQSRVRDAKKAYNQREFDPIGDVFSRFEKSRGTEKLRKDYKELNPLDDISSFQAQDMIINNTRRPFVPPAPITEATPKFRPMSIQEAIQQKSSFDPRAKFNSTAAESAGTDAARQSRAMWRDAIDEAIGKQSPQTAETYKGARARISKLLSARDALENAGEREIANQKFSLGDMLLGPALGGAAGYITGDEGGGVLGIISGMAANRMRRKYGDAIASQMHGTAAKILRSQGVDRGVKSILTMYGPEAGADILDAMGLSGAQ